MSDDGGLTWGACDEGGEVWIDRRELWVTGGVLFRHGSGVGVMSEADASSVSSLGSGVGGW